MAEIKINQLDPAVAFERLAVIKYILGVARHQRERAVDFSGSAAIILRAEADCLGTIAHAIDRGDHIE